MLLVAPVREAAIPMTEISSSTGHRQLNIPWTSAITHQLFGAYPDGFTDTVRPLIALKVRKPDKCGSSASFNVESRSLCPRAYRCFMRTQIDFLVTGQFLLEKQNPRRKGNGSGFNSTDRGRPKFGLPLGGNVLHALLWRRHNMSLPYSVSGGGLVGGLILPTGWVQFSGCGWTQRLSRVTARFFGYVILPS
jgi:hypothetical protein